MRKGIKMVCISVCICLLLITFTGCSEQSTPEKTMQQFQKAYNNLDWDGMLECLDPSVAKGMKAATQLMGDALGFDVDTMMQMMPMMKTLLPEETLGQAAKIELKVESITTNKDIAYAIVSEKSTGLKTTFILRQTDNVWYISLSPEDYVFLENVAPEIITSEDVASEGTATVEPTAAPKSEAELKYERAERQFSLGRYEEAITLYDEIATVIDVEARRAYALECKEQRDLYFTWAYNENSKSDIELGGLVLEKYTGYGMEEVVIPYGTCGLTSRTFSGQNESIVAIELPQTLTVVPVDCFSGCENLNRINIPESVKYLALNGTDITELTVPETVETIPAGAFKDCSRLKKVVFEGQPSLYIGYDDSGVFENCSALETITVPTSFGEVQSRMFVGCTSLKSVVIEDGIQLIRDSAFSGCTSLESVELPESLTEIRNWAFANCTSLQEIKLPSGVTTLSLGLFEGCSSLQNVVLPASLDSISNHAFTSCVSLQEIVLPKTVKYISDIAFGEMDYTYGDENYLSSYTLVVTKGTYGQRYAEERGLSYIYQGDATKRVPLGYRFTMGENNGVPIEWIVIAHNGDNELALSIRPITQRAYHSAGGDPSYSESEIKMWLEKTFYNEAFTADQQRAISSIQLLSSSYYKNFICKKTIEDNILLYNEGSRLWWLKGEYANGEAFVATEDIFNNKRVTDVYDIRPSIIVSISASNKE